MTPTHVHISDHRVAHFDLLVTPRPGETVVVHIDDERIPGLTPTHRTKTYTTRGATDVMVVTGECSCP